MMRPRFPWGSRLILLGLLVLIPLSCGDDYSSGPSGSTVQITGCDTVSYQGVSWGPLGCRPGVASFTATITQAGRSACFNVTCSAGCISSARVC